MFMIAIVVDCGLSKCNKIPPKACLFNLNISKDIFRNQNIFRMDIKYIQLKAMEVYNILKIVNQGRLFMAIYGCVSKQEGGRLSYSEYIAGFLVPGGKNGFHPPTQRGLHGAQWG